MGGILKADTVYYIIVRQKLMNDDLLNHVKDL